MSTLEDKAIVVTGASGRLGRLMVQQFAGDGAVIAAVVRSEEEARNLPFPEDGEGWAFPVDVTDEALVEACFDQIRERLGRVDALVHAVGMWESRPLLETTLEQWESVLRINLTSTFLCFREAVRVMGGAGTLVAFASGQGADGGEAEQAAYAAAKAGVIRLVEAVNEEHDGITAHAIAPSTILYEDAGEGVAAQDLVDLTASVIGRLGNALTGTTIRAYGSS